MAIGKKKTYQSVCRKCLVWRQRAGGPITAENAGLLEACYRF
jgi:hypothetical protein